MENENENAEILSQRRTGEILARHVFNVGVCVPKDWDDKRIIAFTEKQCPCGTTGGWGISERHDRFQCERYSGNVHIILIA